MLNPQSSPFSIPPCIQERPEHEDYPGVDEGRQHQHQAGRGGPGDGAGHAGLPASWEGRQDFINKKSAKWHPRS